MPVTKIQSLSQMNTELIGLKKQYESLAKKVGQSSSFYGVTGAVKPSDMSLDIQQRALKTKVEALNSKIVAQKMYGPKVAASDTESQPKEQGLIMKGLEATNRPLNVVAGTVEWLAGKGKESYGETIKESVAQKKTFGTLLRNSGVTPWVSMPLGFAMDVIADPFNLMSGGWAGLERTVGGKIVKGAAKEGLTGAKLAVKGSALTGLSKIAKATGLTLDKKVTRELLRETLKAEKVGVELVAGSPEYMKILKTVFYPETKTAVGKAMQTVRLGATRLGRKASEAKQAYDKMIGFNAVDIVDARAQRDSLSERLRTSLESMPGGEKLKPVLEFFNYDSNALSQKNKLFDDVIAYGTGKSPSSQTIKNLFLQKTPTQYQDIEKILEEVRAKAPIYVKNPIVSNLSEADKVFGDLIDDAVDTLNIQKYVIPKINDSQRVGAKLAEEAANNNIIKDAANIKAGTPPLNVAKETVEAEKEFLASMAMRNKERFAKTGVAKYIDNKISKIKIKNIEVGKEIIRDLDIFNGIFVKMKVSSLSPSSMVSATIGNPIMALMYGFNITSRNFKKSLGDAAAVISNGAFGSKERALRVMSELGENPTIKEFLKRRRVDFIDNFGLNPLKTNTIREQLVNRAASAMGEGKNEALKDQMLELIDKLSRDKAIEKFLEESKDSGYYIGKSAGEAIGKETTSISNSSNYEGFMKFQEGVNKSASEGNKAAKFFKAVLNRSADFQKVDQTYKFGMFLNLAHYGISEKELLRITANFITTNARVRKADVLSDFWRDGVHYFKLTPDKAMEIASDVYMNYAAMPEFVKILKAMKIAGAPFFAFTFAMMQKTGKTFLNNPAALNKLSFLMQELGGEKSPAERNALTSSYYSWFNNPGMLRLGENVPFFKDHPVYLNMAQMIPYLSLNIVNPSERNFDDSLRGGLASTLDRSPLFKTPIGQVLLDYGLLPAIANNGIAENMWGSPLYPQGTSAIGKTGYAVRSLGEALLPGGMAPVGWGLAASGIPDAATTLLPSYPLRKTVFAVQGKSLVGVIGSEDAASRGLRDLLSQLGIKLYPMDLRSTITEFNRRAK